jgi:uncharacterized membrane protein YgcG
MTIGSLPATCVASSPRLLWLHEALPGRRVEREALTYSNESVVARIQAEAGVDRDIARAWFNEMLVFLDLAAGSKQFISPPAPVDVAWHAFILHTRDYEAYCRERFGRVIHHEPTGSPDPAAYRRAYERRAQHGPLDAAIWAAPVGVAVGEAGSSDGEATRGGDFGSGASGGDFGSAGDAGGGGSSCGSSSCGGGRRGRSPALRFAHARPH